jgi:enoyl-CoA hydratase/carnithine racemase
MTDTDKILTRADGGIRWLILNQPDKLNALSLDMTVRAREVIEAFAAAADERVLVLTGASDKAFNTGADISEFADKRDSAESSARYSAVSTRVFDALAAVEKPTIAMIHGYCMGGGVALAACCDIRICADDAQFAIPAARLGIAYRPDFTQRIIDLVGRSNTREILYTARRYGAGEAKEMGLVNRVVAKAELDEFVRDYAAVIAANAPLSIRATKVITGELAKDPAARDLDRCQDLADACADSRDYAEARHAFMEKRNPVFTGD